MGSLPPTCLGKGHGPQSGFDESSCLMPPMAVLLMGSCKDSPWWSLLLIQDTASPKGWSRARSLSIPGYEGQRHGQLELKTALHLDMGIESWKCFIFNMKTRWSSVRRQSYTMYCLHLWSEDNKDISLLFCSEQLLREYFSAQGASWLMHCNGLVRMEVLVQHQLCYDVQICIWMCSLWSINMVI